MRVVGIPVALFVIVAVPVLIGQQSSQSAPAEAKLTVHLSGDQGGPNHSAHLRVRAAGAQPNAPSTLVDDSGHHTATVNGDTTPDACKNAPLLDSGAGSDSWCLELSNVADGAEMTGVATGPSTKLTLTVSRRNSFLWLPLIVLIGGIIVAAIVALAPNGLRRLVRRVALARLLEQNRHAKADQAIAGLEGWVTAQLAAGADLSTVYDTAASVIKQGPVAATRARHSLSEALEGDPLGRGHPFATAAAAQAERTDHKVDDFFDADGKPQAQHPAAAWLGALKKMEANAKELTAAETTIETEIEAGCRRDALHALSVARVTFARIDSPDAVTDLDDPLETLTKTIDETLATEGCRTRMAGLTEEDLLMSWSERDVTVEAVRGLPAQVEQLTLPAAGRALDAWGIFAVALTLLACLAILVFAGITVEEATYHGNDTFAGWHDYFTLFSAALASGAAASVLSLLAYWRPDPPAATSQDTALRASSA